MTLYRTFATGCIFSTLGLYAQITTINNAYNPGAAYPTYSSVSQGGLVTTSYYDPYGAGYQFPSAQFPSPQFPSASTPTPINYGAPAYGSPYGSPYATPYNPSPFGAPAAPYGAAPYGAPGVPPVTFNTPTLTQPASITPTPISSTPLRQNYPQPALPGYSGYSSGVGTPTMASVRPLQLTSQESPAALILKQLPLQVVAPEEKYTPGLATINKDGKWAVHDLFYNMPPNIGVKIEVIKPEDRYLRINEGQLEQRVKAVLGEARITPEAIVAPCSPSLPMYYVIVMAYPCGRTCIGMITTQLYENAKPTRIDTPINGVWQVVSWERQSFVASACEDFDEEVARTVEAVAREFGAIYKYYNPLLETPCFDTVDRPLLYR